MKKYKYNSQHACHLTLIVDGEIFEQSLFEGGIYDLPEGNSVVKRMCASGHLSGVETMQAVTATVNTEKPDRKNNKENFK